MMSESQSSANLYALNNAADTFEPNDAVTPLVAQEESSKIKCIKKALYHALRVILLAAWIAWYVFNILAIVSVSPTHASHLCSASHLWDYMLTHVVFAGMACLAGMLQENSKTYWLGVLFLSVALTVWGALELCIVKCVEELAHTLLYQMTNVNVVGSILVYFCLLMYGICQT